MSTTEDDGPRSRGVGTAADDVDAAGGGVLAVPRLYCGRAAALASRREVWRARLPRHLFFAEHRGTQGSTFAFTLPVVVEQQINVEPMQLAGPLLAQTGRRGGIQ